MPDLSHCPDGEELRQLASGTLAPVSAEPVLHHLRQCRSCLSALEGMPIEDTLIEALQTWGDRARDGDKAAVAGLIQRLKKLVVGPAADPEATAADAPATRANVFDFLSPPQGADEIGRLGGYRVVKVLGQGGMGVVFAAEDVRLKRKVALKVMKPELAANTGARQRFLREAEASAAVRSDHVITIYQVGEQGDAPFLAMEYLEGMSLDDWLKKGRKPTLAQAARMGRQIALGLAAAHERGLIHRDIKPGNIWLESHHQGRVKLLDFGLARGTTDEVQLTQSGAIVGTPAYMAPEQARGEHVDHRCDLFSLGVVLYRLTTGQLPFRGDNTMSVLTSLALDTPKPPREIDTNIPPRMATLIECLLSKDREQRPKTAKAAADELAAIEREATQPAMDDRTVQIRAASVSERLTRGADATPLAAPSRSRLRWLVAASLMLLLGGVAAAIIVIIRDKAGNKVAEMDVPPGGTVETKDKAEGNAKAPPKEDTKIAAAPLPPLLPGEPLSPTALVRQPTKLPGVRSWSIETRNVWSPSAVAYRPDGKRLAVGSVDGSIRVWEPQTGRLVQMLLGSSHVASLAWSPDGRVLAAGGHTEKQLVRLWDAEKGRLLRALEVPDAQSILGFAWSPDGRTLRAWTGGHCLAWRTTDGKLLRKYLCPGGSLAFSPDGKRLAISGADRASVSIRDADTGVEIRKLSGIKEGRGVGWSPDGKRVACAAEEGVRVWETETSKEIAHYDVKDFSGHCVGVVWSPDGRSLAVDMQDRVVLLEVAGVAKPRSIEGGLGPTPAWSPDGKRIARATCIIDIATGGLVRTLSEGVGGLDVAWSPDGPRFAAYVWNTNQAYLSSLDNGQVFAVLKDAGGRAAWSADGKFVATSSPNGNVLVFDAAGKRLHTLAGHQGYLAGMAWSPDGKRLATCAAPEKRVLLWDLEKGQLLHELGPFAAATAGVRWSPDGRLVAFQVAGCGWHIWDVEQNKLANDPKQWMLYEGGGPVGLRFAPDSRAALVNKSEDGLWRLRNLATRTEGKPLPVCTPPVWSPDGRLLAVPLVTVTPETRDLVELWTGDLRRRVRTLRATIANVSMAGFSRDGKLVAGMSGERLHVWETDTGRLRGILLPHPSANGLTITADGHYTGNEQVERGIVMVVQKNDGTQEVLEPADFEQKYGWKNDPNKVHLLQPLPPSLYPLPGMPMGHTALVREPAVLPDAWSWTIETVSARGAVKAVAYRPDGKQLASGGEDGAIRIWDTASGKLVRMLVGDPVESLWWSKDGKVLTALGANEGEGREWDADTGRPLRRIAGVAKHSMKTASSPDGKQTATADEHGVHLLDAASGKRTHTLEESIH
ncbi:MAG TPA: WD40 repeat domain-containing serine/threonine-protein kinase, partial [Gemmataceae bacterium]|nr:WD40 repeat domain-containing serine/threonine-protein kinase [Gemmataceae bacterium]